MRVAPLLVVLLILPTVAGEDGGVNSEADLTGTPIESLSYPSSFTALGEEGGLMSMELEIRTDENISSIEWVTQVCVNSGVCYPPVYNDMIGQNGTWVADVEIEADASYVNWRFDIEHTNNSTSERIPTLGWGWKIWSTCWFDGTSWGGDDFPTEIESWESCVSSLDGGPESSDGLLSVPYGGAVLAILSLGTAALMPRRV